MGLDMYAHYQNKKVVGNEIVIEEKETEYAYWRKQNALHGFFLDWHLSRGGDAEFNCETLEITEELLDALEHQCKNKMLTPRSGFFWGSQDKPTDEDYQSYLAFIEDSRELLKQGKYLTYYPSY